MRSWAAFTKTAADICDANARNQITSAIARSAIAHLAAAE
jgi:hypothetical protein